MKEREFQQLPEIEKVGYKQKRKQNLGKPIKIFKESYKNLIKILPDPARIVSRSYQILQESYQNLI